MQTNVNGFFNAKKQWNLIQMPIKAIMRNMTTILCSKYQEVMNNTAQTNDL